MDEWKKEILRKWEDVHDAPDDVIRGLIIDDVEKYLMKKFKGEHAKQKLRSGEEA